MRALTGQVQPRITAQALTFTTQRAQKAIVDQMPRVFEGGASRYSLNSTRIEPASVQKLFARVAVKDKTSSGTLPENYLFPSVYGGSRKEKRFERALRFDGLLKSGERAIPGDAAPLDSLGNYRLGELKKLIRELRGSKRDDGPKKTKPRKGAQLQKQGAFVGRPNKAGAQMGVYQRYRRGKDRFVRPLLIFVTKQPRYTQRLDFEGIARSTAQREFPEVFARLLRKATGGN